MNTQSFSRSQESGSVFGTLLHVVLLLCVLGQVVFLASRYRVRVDATSESLYSLTDSTRAIVDGLDKRLLVEAYFSPQADLPAQLRDTRTVLDNFLDELVQLGNGKIVVQRFNPLEGKEIQDKCTRIGVKPIDLQARTTSSTSVQRHWQGMRLVCGERQKVIEQVGPQSSFMAEAVITPAIKEVATENRLKIGFMEWPSDPVPGKREGRGWQQVRTHPAIYPRYNFVNVLDGEGALLPDDIDSLFLFRPRDLTDRQKYVIDQFLMRGGNLVLFADGADYSIAPRRQFQKIPVQIDAEGSESKFRAQLLSYGLDVRPVLVADMQPQAHQAQNPLFAPFEYFGLPQGRGMTPVGYPYFMHSLAQDWAEFADQLSQGDERLAETYRKTLRPGIDSDAFLFQAFKKIRRGPPMYWPCWVGLREKAGEPDLPKGVDGSVLLWSSPLALAQDPPASVDPLGGNDPMARQANYSRFISQLNQQLQSQARQQVPLMAEVDGRFPSFFSGKPRPKRAAEIKWEEAQKAAAEDAKEEDADPLEEPVKDDPAAAAEKPGQDPVSEKPEQPEMGPPAPPEAEASEVPEPDPEAAQLTEATAAGRIVAIADSDFIRDDLLRGDYRQLGGPVSLNGLQFFAQLLDWISQDDDLVALQSRIPVDRKLQLVDVVADQPEDPRDAELYLLGKTAVLVFLNATVPCVLLLVLGLSVFVSRRAQKRSFLQSTDN
ncbi:MAG: Gldg family protein [Planctomycetota bacterium]|nr:Gldg family protein [Planctomycetota bacterium]